MSPSPPAPPRASGPDDAALASLRRWNLGLTVLHAAQAVLVLVLAGIPADARIIVAGQELVTEGDVVDPKEADRATIEKLVATTARPISSAASIEAWYRFIRLPGPRFNHCSMDVPPRAWQTMPMCTPGCAAWYVLAKVTPGFRPVNIFFL